MTRGPPRSPLFPYTTCCQSKEYGVSESEILVGNGSLQLQDLVAAHFARPGMAVYTEQPSYDRAITTFRRRGARRSEEHTSELQSRQYLVCRLLLEKKNYLNTLFFFFFHLFFFRLIFSLLHSPFFTPIPPLSLLLSSSYIRLDMHSVTL